MVSLANIYAVRGFVVDLVTLDDLSIRPDAFQLNDNVRRHLIPTTQSGSIYYRLRANAQRYLRLRRLLIDRKPDVLLSFMTPTNILAIVATRGLNVRCVVSERIDPAYYSYGFAYNMLRHLVYKKADCVVAQTVKVSRWLQKHTNCRTSVIPNYVRGVSDLFRVRRKQEIIAVGRLAHQKGFDILIHAFSIICIDHPDWRLLIYGEGPAKNALQALIEEYSLQHKIKLCGFSNSLRAPFFHASIAVQPSRFEGFPNALLEAMAHGIPCIATQPAGEMLIDDGMNGIQIPVNDVESLANALRRLITDPGLRECMGDKALEASRNFSQEKIIKLWDSVLFPSADSRLEIKGFNV